MARAAPPPQPIVAGFLARNPRRRTKRCCERSRPVAFVGAVVDRPDPRARAIYRAELRDEVDGALRDGRPTRVVAIVDEALREAAARNLPGWTASDLAWLAARREEARASRSAGGAS